MGFLTMIGAVPAEEHANLKTLFDRVAGERNQALIDQSKAEENANKYKQQVRDTCARAEKAEAGLAEAKAAYDNEHADLKNATQTIKGLRAQLEAAQQVIEQHKADVSELATFRAARDRDNELRRQRRAKVKPAEPAKPVVKAKPAKKAVRK